MIGIDSNVLVRLIVRDDPVQTTQADRILDRAGDEGMFVSLVVLAEVAWVLKRAYRRDPPTVLAAIERVLAGREFLIERAALADAALANARQAGCGFADAVIERVSLEAGAAETLTFDIRAKRLPTMRDAASFS
jgi:predicted nucleic-acid-binding protein